MTHGGLHIPKEKFQFTGSVAEIDQKLQVELFEWHRLKATEKATAEQQVETAQNGAQVEDQPQDQPENEERSPSQQRES